MTERRADALILAVLTLVGLALRLYDIGRESYWLDEAGRVAIALRPLADIPHDVGVIELSPPLYHFVLHGWIALFGASETAVRLLSALLVIPTVPLAAAVGEVVGSRAVRWGMAAIAATSPFAVHYGQEAAMYALLLPLGLLTLVAALGVLEGPQPTRARWLGVYTVAGALALYTHYYAAFLLLGVLIVALWHAWRRRAVHGVVLWLAAHAAIAALFAPWLPIFFRQAGLAASVEDWSGIAPLDAALRWANATLADNAAGWGVPALVVLGGAIALGGWTLRTRSGPLAGLTLTIVVLPLVLATAASGFLHSFRERGFLAVIGAPWLLMVTGIAGSPRRWTRIAALVLTAGIAVLSLVGLRAHYAERKEDWRTAAALISQNGGPGDPIFLVHFAGEVPLDLYLTSAPPRVGLPLDFDWETGYTARYVVTPQDVEQRVPPALANASRAWAVLSHDQGRGSDYLIAALARWGQRSGQWQLNGVRVFRYDRR